MMTNFLIICHFFFVYVPNICNMVLCFVSSNGDKFLSNVTFYCVCWLHIWDDVLSSKDDNDIFHGVTFSYVCFYGMWYNILLNIYKGMRRCFTVCILLYIHWRCIYKGMFPGYLPCITSYSWYGIYYVYYQRM